MNAPLENWNQNLPRLSIICQIIISTFLIITAANIKVFFKCKATTQGKPKIKNTISFKWINILYSIGLIFETILHLILMQNHSKNTFIMHYDITTAFNLMLITFLVSDKDAKKFCLFKMRSWKEQQWFQLKDFNLMKKHNKVGQMNKDLKTRDNVV